MHNTRSRTQINTHIICTCRHMRTQTHKYFLSPAAQMRGNKAQVRKKGNWHWHTVLDLPGVLLYLMTVFPLSLYTVCHHCLQCLDFLSNRDSFYACWWQSDNLLQMLCAPPEAYLISWFLLYHPSPPAPLSDCLLLWPGLGGVSMWACREHHSQGSSITRPSPFWSVWMEAGLDILSWRPDLRPRSLPSLLRLISPSLHPSVSLPSQTE